MMRRIFILIFSTMGLALFAKDSNAQNAISSLSIKGGISTANTKMASLALEKSKNGYTTWGLTLDGMWYANKEHNRLSWKSDNKILSLGLFYKGRLSASRNFSLNYFVGGAGGSDNHTFLYYPFGGIEQNIFLSNNLILSIDEKALYLMGYDKLVNWQPTINLGLKFRL